VTEGLPAGRLTEPWERQRGETAKAFAAFVAYREQSPDKRTLAAAARATYGERGVRKNGQVIGVMQEWIRRHEWAARAAAWDAHLDDLRRREDEKAVVEMQQRHLREAELIQRTLLSPAMALANRLRADPQAQYLFEGTELPALVRLADRAGRGYDRLARFERLVRGIADRLEVTGAGGGPIEVSMTVEQACLVLAPYLGVEPADVPQAIADRRRQLREAEGEEEASAV
jgi:hypothetical protein